MGGEPFLALNIAALPPALPAEICAEILRGGAEKAREAGVALVGGHTVQDKEPKYGLVVLGFVHPERIISKGGARPGDVLVLTKPLGFGTVTTALKRGLAEPADVAEAVYWMSRLNRDAGRLAVGAGVRGGTDVTGFSLLGHGSELAEASGAGLRIYASRVPILDSARRYAAQWIFPGGTADNRLYFSARVQFAAEIDEAQQMLLFDAQTSGGLLLAVPPERLSVLQARAAELGQPLWTIGEVTAGSGIEVLP